MSSIEFLISASSSSGDGLVVQGVCNAGIIKLGSQFAELIKESDGQAISVKPALQVSKIIAYRREIDELPTGMTGELHLSGKIDAQLVHGHLLKGM